MEEQAIEVDSVADLHVVLEDDVGPDVVDNIGMGEVLPEEPEGEALVEAGDLADFDVGMPSRTADSVSATAGTSTGGTMSLLGSISHRIVPSWLGWPGWGTSRSDPVAASRTQQHSRGGSRSAMSVDRVPDSSAGLLISKYRVSSILYRRYFLSIDGLIAATSENSYR